MDRLVTCIGQYNEAELPNDEGGSLTRRESDVGTLEFRYVKHYHRTLKGGTLVEVTLLDCAPLEFRRYVKHYHLTLKGGTLVEVTLLLCTPCRPGHRRDPEEVARCSRFLSQAFTGNTDSFLGHTFATG